MQEPRHPVTAPRRPAAPLDAGGRLPEAFGLTKWSDRMGVLAESMAAYAQPLLEATAGSLEQVNRALALAQVCWGLALLPEEARNEALLELEPSLKMEADDERVPGIVPAGMPGRTDRCERTVATHSGANGLGCSALDSPPAPGPGGGGSTANARQWTRMKLLPHDRNPPRAVPFASIGVHWRFET